jgi:hypothetical protein
MHKSAIFQGKSSLIRVAAQTNISWNQEKPEIIKEIISINKFKE